MTMAQNKAPDALYVVLQTALACNLSARSEH